MAVIEQSGLMKYKDANGNVYLMLPITNTDNVDGLEEMVEEAKILAKGVITAGDSSAYTATVAGITALESGLSFIIVPHITSTVTNPTLNVNNLGAKTLRIRISGSSSTTTAASTTNWLVANKPVRVTYDGLFWVAEMVRPNANDIYGTVAIEKGGTGATTAEQARINLGITTGGGTVTSGNADYAEIGEWVDGNTSNEDRIGYFVAIDTSTSGTTMVKATSTADVRGVTVTAPAFSGGCDASKYDAKTGELLQQYEYVAVMGLVSVIDNGTCTINGRCMPTDDGTAVPSSNNMGYQVIDRVDDTHILIAVEPGADMIQRIKDDMDDKASKPSSVSVALAASGWDSTSLTQTVTVSGVLADETAQLITPTPASASQSAYYEAGILCTGQAVDSLTFTAKTAPTEKLTVYVVIHDVNYTAPLVTLISFTIDSTTYQAEEDMTWGEWVNSKYCTDGRFEVSSDYIYCTDAGIVVYTPNEMAPVAQSDTIISGAEYWFI